MIIRIICRSASSIEESVITYSGGGSFSFAIYFDRSSVTFSWNAAYGRCLLARLPIPRLTFKCSLTFSANFGRDKNSLCTL